MPSAEITELINQLSELTLPSAYITKDVRFAFLSFWCNTQIPKFLADLGYCPHDIHSKFRYVRQLRVGML